MTWLVASISAETGIAPQAVMEDGHMMKALVAVLHERQKQRERAQRG